MMEPVLEARELAIAFGAVSVVEGVAFQAYAGECLCILGESGSGKSLSLLAAMGLLPEGARVCGGQLLFEGVDMATLDARALRRLRGPALAMVFQDPMTALNPIVRIGDQIAEMLTLHRSDLRGRALKARVVELLAQVGVPGAAARYGAYPHQLSGGMRQRVMIAMAMAHSPKVLIADEPTTALDVTIQAQVLDLLAEMRAAAGSAMVLITHDLGVAADHADRVCVVYAGRTVETARVSDLFLHTRHPYTVGLLASRLGTVPPGAPAFAIPGQPPAAAARPPGCAFHPRCALRRGRPICSAVTPPLRQADGGHLVACHFQHEVAAWIAAELPHLEAAGPARTPA